MCIAVARSNPLVDLLKGLWRARIGKYRIIYETDEKEKVIVSHDVDLHAAAQP
jgi:mRNA-degrading endonuclease RelE of RelBE toxin-antitoxin system